MQFQSTNQPTWKKRLLKVVNVAAQVVMVINLSYLGVLLTPTAASAANPAGNLDQCRNGSATSPNDCLTLGGGAGWVNGNAGASQAHYVEGHSIPYRLLMTDLPINTSISLTLGYDITHSSAHAIDYLTSYDRLLPHAQFGHGAETVDPTDGIAGISGAADDTFPIPAPSSVSSPVSGMPTNSFNALSSAEKLFSGWNVDITNIAYGTQGNLNASQSETTIVITFKATSSKALLAWGGHIAGREDWGDGNSAGGISGSPYHMRQKSWNIGTLGNQDRSLAAAAVEILKTPPVVNPPLTEACGLDIALVFDGSGSIDSTEYGMMQTAFNGFVNSFLPGTPTSMSITEFATDGLIRQPFTNNAATLHNEINESRVQPGGQYTNWEDGLYQAHKTFINDTVKPDLVVFASDGNPNTIGVDGAGTDNNAGTEQIAVNAAVERANDIKDENIRIVALGIGDDLDTANLIQISGPSVAHNAGEITENSDVIEADFSTLSDVLSGLAHQLCGGKILVQKQFDTNGDGQADIDGTSPNTLLSGYTFDVDGSPSNPAAQATTNSGSLEFSDVLNGTYSVTETDLPVGTQIVSASCVNGQESVGTFSSQSKSVTGLVMGTDDTVSCTFINGYQKGSLKVTKVVQGGQATPDQFGFRLVGSNGAYTYPTSGQNNVTFSNLQPGAYSVEETGPAGYHQTATTCTNKQVQAGQQATCTITNARNTGHVTFDKVVPGHQDAESLFTFHVDGTGTYHDGDSTDLEIGTYTVTEDAVSGYSFDSASGICAYNNGKIVMTVTENGGTCTVTNTRDTGKIKVNKCVDTDANGTFETCNKDMYDAQIDFRWGIDQETPTRPFGQQVTVETGTYGVTENSLDGYHFVGWGLGYGADSCDKLRDTTLPASLDVTKNATKEITLCNARNTGGLTVLKSVDTDGDGKVDITNDASWTWDVDGGNQNYATGTTQTVLTGSHQVSEDNKDGYHNISWVCVDSQTQAVLGNGTGTTLNVDVSTHGATCTFTNARDTGTIQGYKFNDLNGNGVWDNVEPGLAGWTIQLSTGASTLTDANGHYVFNLVPTGSYTVSEVQQNGWMNTTPNPVTSVAVVYNQSATVNFGNFQKFSVRVCKKVDLNGNGDIANDPYYTAGGWDMTLNQTTQSTDGGCTTFSNLGPGAYNLNEASKTGWVRTYPANATYQFNGVSGQNRDYVFGNFETPKLTVIKHVINNNGRSAVASDFTMKVTGTNVSNDSFSGDEAGTTVTLGAGDYSVDELDAAGYAKTIGDDCSGTVHSGDHPVCTITNDDVNFDVTLEKSGPVSVAAGNQITYTLDWSVTGNLAVDSLVITDPIPALTTFVSADNSGTESAGTVTWDLGPQSAGANGTVHVTVQTESPLYNGTVVENEATVCGYVQSTQQEKCDTDDHTVTVTSGFNVTTDKSGPETAVPGEEITYTIHWELSGNSPVDSIVIKDTVPADTSFVTASNGGTENGGIVTWTLISGPYNPGDSGDVTLTVKLADVLYDGTIIYNAEEICGYTADNTPTESEQKPVIIHCDDDDTTTEVNSDFQVQIEKTGQETAEAGDSITYTLEYLVIGNSPVDSLIITDTVPTGTTYVDASVPGSYDSNTNSITWDLGSAQPGDSGSVTITVTVNDVDGGTIITNTGEICGTVVESPAATHAEEPTVRCDEDTTTTEVIEPVLTLDKVVVDEPTFYNPGDTVTYSVTITNTGTAVAKNLVLTDTLPTGFTFSGTGLDTKTFTLGDLAIGASTVVTYDVIIGDDVLAGFYDNVAQLTADNHDPLEDTETVEVRVPQVLGTEPELVIAKNVNVSFANPGDTITYTVTVKNIGEGAAIDVILRDALPDGFVFTDTGTKTKLWTLGTIQPNESVTVDYEVTIAKSVVAGFYDNLAIASAENHKPVTATAMVEVRPVQVLAATGIQLRDYLILLVGALLIAAGALMLRRRSAELPA